jgi:hypothetical protein
LYLITNENYPIRKILSEANIDTGAEEAISEIPKLLN